MPKTPKEHCAYKNETGDQCKAYPAKGTSYCIGHARNLGKLPVVGWKDGGVTPVVLDGDWKVKVQDDPVHNSVQVNEPEALKVLRSMTTQIELGGGIDPVLSTQLANILRPYFGGTPMDGIELATHIDQRVAADEQVAKAMAARLDLIERSRELIIERPDEAEAARIQAKVNRDIEEAAGTYRARADQMRLQLKNEPREAVTGTGSDEVYSVNGIKIVVPAEGQWSVPQTIANLHRERLRQRREKRARSDLMQSVPEYSQVQAGMARIDAQYGSRSQLGGGQSKEQDDFLVAEEIK